jgi:predicted RNA-binding protein YlqC (UPF0109 family)
MDFAEETTVQLYVSHGVMGRVFGREEREERRA